MRCLINHARSRPADPTPGRSSAPGRKVGDLFECGFSHTACGRSFDTYPRRFGYAPAAFWGRTSPGGAASAAPARC